MATLFCPQGGRCRERFNCIYFLRVLISIENWKKLLPAMNLSRYRFTKILFDNPASVLRVRKMVFLNGSDPGFSVNQNKIYFNILQLSDSSKDTTYMLVFYHNYEEYRRLIIDG